MAPRYTDALGCQLHASSGIMALGLHGRPRYTDALELSAHASSGIARGAGIPDKRFDGSWSLLDARYQMPLQTQFFRIDGNIAIDGEGQVHDLRCKRDAFTLLGCSIVMESDVLVCAWKQQRCLQYKRERDMMEIRPRWLATLHDARHLPASPCDGIARRLHRPATASPCDCIALRLHRLRLHRPAIASPCDAQVAAWTGMLPASVVL